jgi:4-hydroxythreonine-4-phosphate dehydrogenase
MSQLPSIALSAGDPAGIGPELVAAALADPDLAREVRIVAVGPGALRPAGVEPQALEDVAGGGERAGHAWVDSGGDPRAWRVGEVGAASGRAALDALRAGHELALAGAVDGLVTAPVSKQALSLAGERVEGQTELLARWCGVRRYEMLAVAGELRVMLLSRHMPLRQALDCVREERVLERLELLGDALRTLFGVAVPRLALAGLNPHAGENGLLGDEEDLVLRPAVARARERGLDVVGPLPPDSIFVRGARGEWDGVLALYHDQAFIPIKLLSGDAGVTVIAGLPYLRVSPTHGTAFDLAGSGRARPDNLFAALRAALRLARTHSPKK